MPSNPAMAATGMVSSSAARPRSAAIMIGLRLRRSTHAPATSPTMKAGSSSAMRRAPRSAAEASSSRMAVKGIAVRVISDPKVETVAAPQRWTKSAFRQRFVRRTRVMGS